LANFSTVTGSNGITSLVGTTGVDVASIVASSKDLFIGGNTGNDVVTTALGTGGNNLNNWDVRMGGGNDVFTQGNALIDSEISLDGLTLGNDGNDTFNGGGVGNLFLTSDLRGMAGNDTINNLALSSSTVNGNAGTDTITIVASTNSSVFGGAGADAINTTAGAANSSSLMTINGNKGADVITLAASGFTGTVFGGQDNDTITAAAVTTAAGGALGITATGVTINGDIGADGLTGSNGVDVITGGTGADTITGGTGADTLTGGTQADTFRFVALSSGTTAATADTITDYVTAVDIIDDTAVALTAGANANAAVAGASASITATSLASFNVADNTTAERITAVAGGITLGATSNVNGASVIFQGGSNETFLFVSDGANGVTANDYLVQVTGATANTGITLGGGNIITIA
jgi:Ca2+-binding RTX toxin-like protein